MTWERFSFIGNFIFLYINIFFLPLYQMQMRPLTTVLLEATVIGVMNLLIFMLLNRLFKLSTPVKLFIGGALIHIAFEYSGGNEWWCKSTY